jgi:hypothetical protein
MKYVSFGEGKDKTPFLKSTPNKNELSKLRVSQLVVIAKRYKGLKTILIDFLMSQKELK